MPKTHQPATTLSLLHLGTIEFTCTDLQEHTAALSAPCNRLVYTHNTGGHTTPEGVALVLGSFDGLWDVVTAANVLQHAQDSFVGTPMSRAPQRCNA